MPPLIPPSPIVPALPTTTTQFAGGSSSLSGMVPVSGILTGTDYSGPHMIESQSMDVYYLRMPRFQWSATDWALSGQLDTTMRMMNTVMLYKVQAQHTIVKSYDIYSTSGWTQPQTFAVNSTSADSYGNIYGLAAEFGQDYVLGTQGSIVTEQIWSNRRPWNDSTDIETTSSVELFNYVMAKRTEYGGSITSGYVDALTEYGDFANGASWNGQAFDPNNFLYDPWLYKHGWDYVLPNEYRYTQESLTQLIYFVDNSAGYDVRNNRLYPTLPSDPPTGPGYPIKEGMSTYDPSRHNWAPFT